MECGLHGQLVCVKIAYPPPMVAGWVALHRSGITDRLCFLRKCAILWGILGAEFAPNMKY